jgi:hypothetical protein
MERAGPSQEGGQDRHRRRASAPRAAPHAVAGSRLAIFAMVARLQPVAFWILVQDSSAFSMSAMLALRRRLEGSVEGALDDLSQPSAANVAWFPLSSATTANSSINIFSGPLAGIRLNASAMSSAALTMRVVQGIGW